MFLAKKVLFMVLSISINQGMIYDDFDDYFNLFYLKLKGFKRSLFLSLTLFISLSLN